MRKLLILISILFLGANFLHAQYQYHHPEIFYMPAPGPEKYYADKLENGVSDNPGLQYRFYSGVSFYSLNSFNSISTWLSPKVLLPVNSKMAVEIGATYISTVLPVNENSEYQRINDLIAYARGIYSVNQNLTVYGQLAKSLMSRPGFESADFQSIMMGMEYYVTPNLRIGASIRTQKGIDPFYMTSPYPYSYGGSPWGPYY